MHYKARLQVNIRSLYNSVIGVIYACVHKCECVKHNECLLCARHCFKYITETVMRAFMNVAKKNAHKMEKMDKIQEDLYESRDLAS